MFIQVRSLKRCGFQWSASQQRLSMFFSRTKYTFLLNQMKLIELDEINSTIVWVDRIKSLQCLQMVQRCPKCNFAAKESDQRRDCSRLIRSNKLLQEAPLSQMDVLVAHSWTWKSLVV